MRWFRKKEPIQPLLSEHESTIEIVAHRNAGKRVIDDAKTANDHLQKLLEDNHFTLKIYLAAGGKKRNGQHKLQVRKN